GLELRSLLARGDARPEVVEEVGRDPRRAHETAKTPVLAKRDQTFIEILRDDVDPPVPVDADLERAVIEVRRNNPRDIGFRPPDDPDQAPLCIEVKDPPVAGIGDIEGFVFGDVKPARPVEAVSAAGVFKLTDDADQTPLRVEDDDPVVSGISDVNMAACADVRSEERRVGKECRSSWYE